MKSLAKRLLFLTAFVLSSSIYLSAQSASSYLNDTGSPAYGVNIPVENGFINVSNGNLHMEFTLATHPQRGALTLSEKLAYDSRIWMFSPFGTHGSYHWWPYNIPGTSTSSGGWRFITGNEIGTVSYAVASQYSSPCQAAMGGGDPGSGPITPVGSDPGGGGSGYQGPYDYIQTSAISWTDPAGGLHPFNASLNTYRNDCDSTQNTTSISGGAATDGSGYSIPSDAGGVVRIIDSNGTQVYPTIIDRYGNFWSQDGQGNLVDDTGRTPILVTQQGNQTFYDVLTPTGRARYTVTVASVHVSTTFLPWEQSDIHSWAPSVDYLTPVQSILLPDGVSRYSFTYDINGEMSTMTLPTGGVIHYGYTDFIDSAHTENNWLTSRTVGTDPATTYKPIVGTSCANYSSGCKEYVFLHKPSGDETLYEMTLANGAWNTAISVFTGAVPIGRGLPFSLSAAPNRLMATTTSYQYSNACSGVNCSGANYVTESLASTVLDLGGNPNLFTQTQSTFDPATGKPLTVKEWDYSDQVSSMSTSTPPQSTPARETDYTYTGLDVNSITVLDNTGNKVGQTAYKYSSTAQATTGVAGHGSQNAGGPYLQSVSHLPGPGTGPVPAPLTTTYTMDDTGMVLGVTDPNGNSASTVTYQCSNSLPLKAQDALAHPTQYQFDCASGAILGVQDPNDVASGRSGMQYAYEAGTGRPLSETRADNGKTSYSYPSPNEVDTITTAAPHPSLSARSLIDAFGRKTSSISAGVQADTNYDVNGRINCSTNPYASNSSSSASSCITAYDGLDRPLTQLLQDGVATRTWSYRANMVQASNEKGATWERTYNAFGKLYTITEPNAAGIFTTNYAYDGLGNLSVINQIGNSMEAARVRSFIYDPFGRVKSSTTPEQGTLCYGSLGSGGCIADYDNNGNLRTKTDARGIKTFFSYDKLNRLIQKSYSDNTKPASFFYDAPAAQNAPSSNLIGRLTQFSNGSNASTQFSYDPLGRVVQQGNTLPNGCCVVTANMLSAAYDQAGQLSDLYYPSGHHITQNWDGNGHITSIGDGNLAQAYVQSVTYNPDGSPNVLTLGNGITETVSKNNRLEVANITVSDPIRGQTYLDHSYCYVNCPTGGTVNSGNIWGITDNLNTARTQGFTADNLNRITSFSLGGTVRQQYYADSFGNLTGFSASTPNPPFDYATNRRNLPCASSTLPYDAAGNQLCNTDQYNAVSVYSYDAENRVTQVAGLNSPSAPFVKYTYGADGTRIHVERAIDGAGTSTEYINFGGQTVSEKDEAGRFSDYVIAFGQKIAKVPGMEHRVHTQGYSTGNWGQSRWNLAIPQDPTGGNYIAKAGDRLCWQQYTYGLGNGGPSVWFDNGHDAMLNNITASPDNQLMYFSTTPNAWINRCVDLTFGGTTTGARISMLSLFTRQAGATGEWDIYYADMSLISGDGSVYAIIGVQPPTPTFISSQGDVKYPPSATGEIGPSYFPALIQTHFFAGDALGTAQMEFSSGGWPVWQGQFGPFGEELDTQPASTKYKYAGLERDTETNVDHAQFRQLDYLQGRWMSADPYDGSMDLNDPQSLNRYSYVGNMPLLWTDRSGLEPCPGHTDDTPCFLFRRTDYVHYTDSSFDANIFWDIALFFKDVGQFVAGLFDHPRLKASIRGRPNAARNPCTNSTLSAAGVDILQRNAVTKAAVAGGALVGLAFGNPGIGAFIPFGYLVRTRGPYDDKSHKGPGTYQQRVNAGNISYGVTCPFGAGLCQFSAGAAQTAAGNPDLTGTLATGFDTPSDNASIREGQAMRAAGCD